MFESIISKLFKLCEKTKLNFEPIIEKIRNKRIINCIFSKINKYDKYYSIFRNKCGVEIGGPSSFFNNEIELYKIVKSLDCINFCSETIWEGKIHEGLNFKIGNKVGFQYICDAVNLNRIDSEKYDFVLSCNCLEHIANPLKALTEWKRIICRGGLILIVVPNREYNFDHNRQITIFDHLVQDFVNNISEEDLNHLNEILSLHDLTLDPQAGDFNNFKSRSLDNFHNRCLHHHVFDLHLLKKIFKFLKIKILFHDLINFDYVIIGKKV